MLSCHITVIKVIYALPMEIFQIWLCVNSARHVMQE